MSKSTSRRESHAERILEALRRAGAMGCLNVELWRICHAANSRVADLRKRGYKIEGKRETVTLYRYTLHENSPAAVESLLGKEEVLPF